MNPSQPIKDGIPVPFVRDSQDWDPEKEYSTGDIVIYGGRPYEALRASTGAQPPYPDFDEPTGEWSCIGWDKRIAIMTSGYGYEPPTIPNKAPVQVYPFVEWYDIYGTLISKVEASSGYIGRDIVKVATAAVLPNSPTYNSGAKTLTSTGNAALTIDGISPGTNSALDHGVRVLVKDQADAKQNGIYVVTNLGSGAAQWVLTRADDADASADFVTNMFVYVESGNTLANTRWYLSSATPLVLDTNNITWTVAPVWPWYVQNMHFDSFTDGWSGSLASKAMDVGSATWTQAVGTWLVDAYAEGSVRPSTVATRSVATATGPANTQLGVTFRSAPSGGYTQGLMFRRSDDNNYWRATRTNLRKKVAGVWTTVATYATPFADNDRMNVVLNGNSIAVYRNHDLSSAVASTTDAFNASATIHGLIVET